MRVRPSSTHATRSARNAPASPDLTSFAIAMTSSSVLNSTIAAIGPKISCARGVNTAAPPPPRTPRRTSRTTRIVGFTFVRTVAWKKLPSASCPPCATVAPRVTASCRCADTCTQQEMWNGNQLRTWHAGRICALAAVRVVALCVCAVCVIQWRGSSHLLLRRLVNERPHVHGRVRCAVPHAKLLHLCEHCQ